ncbi:MAG: FAD-dependent oxidoreductase [Actinobacteria bacterium]|nr:FAD-dependent oxidoreductase [Actinomycetota bacterium]
MVSTDVNDEMNFDLVIVGGGPAGLVAAAEAINHQLTVALIDERVTFGGQIYKQMGIGFSLKNESQLTAEQLRGRALIRAIENPLITQFLSTTVLSIDGTTMMIVTAGSRAKKIHGTRLLIAPGAYDRPVAFPGWTLPGVITAGGAQTLVKTQRVSPGSRILFAGSGPLALAFPAQMKSYGANVVLALEAGRSPGISDLFHLLRAVPGNVHLLRDASKYRWTLLKHRVPMRYRRLIVEVGGNGRVEYAIHVKVDRNWRRIPGTEERIEVDTVCVGYGFFPSTELLRLAGCDFSYQEDLGGFTVKVNDWGQTSVEGIFAAGDGAGVEGVYVATARARLASIKIAEELGRITANQAQTSAESSFKIIRAKKRFQGFLFRMYSIGTGIYELADEKTTICRCENVNRASIDEAIETTSDTSVVKAFTRAGMGLCQGRNCQRQVAALISQRHTIDIAEVPLGTPRFPAKPVALGAVADDEVKNEKYFLDA